MSPDVATQPATAEDFEKRAERRVRQLKRARIVEEQTLTTFDCVIRDGHQQGARLKVDSLTQLPGRFRLINDTDENTATCEVMWRKGEELGLRFV